MGISRLSSDKCEHKEMEAFAYLGPATMQAGAEVSQPLLVAHDCRDVKIDANTTVTIDLEELKKQLEREFYQKTGLGLQFGA